MGEHCQASWEPSVQQPKAWDILSWDKNRPSSIYSTALYGSTLWQLNSEEHFKLNRAWNTAVKMILDFLMTKLKKQKLSAVINDRLSINKSRESIICTDETWNVNLINEISIFFWKWKYRGNSDAYLYRLARVGEYSLTRLHHHPDKTQKWLLNSMYTSTILEQEMRKL